MIFKDIESVLLMVLAASWILGEYGFNFRRVIEVPPWAFEGC